MFTQTWGSEETEPYNTQSAEEGGYINMWLHTCNNMLPTFYIYILWHTCEPQSGRVSFLFACIALLFVAGLLACMSFTLQPTDSSFEHLFHRKCTAGVVSSQVLREANFLNHNFTYFYRGCIVIQSDWNDAIAIKYWHAGLSFPCVLPNRNIKHNMCYCKQKATVEDYLLLQKDKDTPFWMIYVWQWLPFTIVTTGRKKSVDDVLWTSQVV